MCWVCFIRVIVGLIFVNAIGLFIGLDILFVGSDVDMVCMGRVSWQDVGNFFLF